MVTNPSPLISVVIPVKNGANTLDAALRCILGQTLADKTEIIVIDSGSMDGTLDIAKRYPVRLHCIQPAEFNHGATRNLGVQLARGEFVVMTVQDAAPSDDRWLAKMLRHFADERVAGVCGKQITPHDPDKNPMQWHRPTTDPERWEVSFQDPSDFTTLPGAERLALSGWDDVTAMYRRSLLLAIPFQPVMFAEDWLWAHDALAAGWKLVHDQDATVCHYHHQEFNFRLRRQTTILYHMEAFWGVMPPPGSWWHKVGQAFWHLFKQGPLSTERPWYWIWYNARLHSADQVAYCLCWLTRALGGRTALERLHRIICKSVPQAITGGAKN